MPTQDLVTNHGGVGDGQRVSVTAAVSSNLLTITGATPFVIGDIGKSIRLNGGTYTTISGFTNSSHVTLTSHGDFTTQTTDILWGTDNTAAFESYRVWAVANGTSQSILTIPVGRYCTRTGPNTTAMNYGVKNALIKGPLNGAATCIISMLDGAEMRFGGVVPTSGHGLDSATGNNARLNTTTLGASTATLTDKTTYGSRIIVGADCLIAGFDMQGIYHVPGFGYGYPQNNYFYEYNTITAYNSTTGVVTFQYPLANVYKSTWPSWDVGSDFGPDEGGPATIWVSEDYGKVVELNDLTLDNPYNQSACHGRDVILRRCVMVGGGLYPTLNKTYSAYGCTYVQSLEIDKMIGEVLFEDCTLDIVHIQSASPNLMTVNGGTIVQMSGTPKNLVMDGVAFTDNGGGTDARMACGPTSFGCTSSISMTDCTGIKTFTGGSAASSTGIDSGGVSATMPMTAGIITILNTDNDGSTPPGGDGENPTRIFVPGTWLFLDNKAIMQVLDVTQDATNTYVHTSLAGSWPFTVTQLRVHPCPDLTVRGCTGTAAELEDLNQAPANTPLYAYSKRTYVKDASGASEHSLINLRGKLVTAKYDVTTASAGSFNQSQFDNWDEVYKSDYTTYTYGPSINVGATGLRTIRDSTTATGNQSDSLPDLTSIGHIWFAGPSHSGPVFNSNNGGATLTVEFIMDQGITPVIPPSAISTQRLKLRFHS